MRRLIGLLLAVVTVGLAVTTAACGDTEREPQVQEIVIPYGTMERLGRGEDVVVMPAELQFKVGDTLRIRNEDIVDQSVGPYMVRAGQQFELTYGSPGRFEGSCPLSEGKRYDIVVTK
jgi:plastocyanin